MNRTEWQQPCAIDLLRLPVYPQIVKNVPQFFKKHNTMRVLDEKKIFSKTLLHSLT